MFMGHSIFCFARIYNRIIGKSNVACKILRERFSGISLPYSQIIALEVGGVWYCGENGK
jgi:hypothetical protein